MKLPQFIYDRIVSHNTSLGANEALPPEEDISFELKLAQNRFKDVVDEVKGIIDLNALDVKEIGNLLGKLIKECREIEKPIRGNLEKVCENVVAKLFVIPDETVNLSCKLVDKITPKHAFRITPESSDNRDFRFKNIAEFGQASKEIFKRRMINALIQGGAYDLTLQGDLFVDEISQIDERLPKLYEKIIKLNDLLLFLKEENITDEKPMQGSYVEVDLGTARKRTEISAQGIIFPFLLTETIRGFFELFASHGLPEDTSKAKYILSQADILVAEAWDLRLGVGLWRMLSDDLEETSYIPYFFRDLCELNVSSFNEFLVEVFARTEQGETNLANLMRHAKYEYEMDDFENAVRTKNAQISVLNDNYLSVSDLDGYMIDDENDDEEIIEEEPIC